MLLLPPPSLRVSSAPLQPPQVLGRSVGNLLRSLTKRVRKKEELLYNVALIKQWKKEAARKIAKCSKCPIPKKAAPPMVADRERPYQVREVVFWCL